MDNLFCNNNVEQTNIFLIDASYSTIQNNKTYSVSNKSIYERMYDFVKSVNDRDNKPFYLIFWNSENDAFPNGTYICPSIISPSSHYRIIFDTVKNKIRPFCTTSTWLGFNAILPNWLTSQLPPHIYLITDGEIGHSASTYFEKLQYEKLLQEAINKTLKLSINNCSITIVAIESLTRNIYNETTNVAGCDVYEIIKKMKLVDVINKFIVFDINQEAHINNVNEKTLLLNNNKRCPPGYYPYNDKIFEQSKLSVFFDYIRQELQTASYDNAVNILNGLTVTMTHALKGLSSQQYEAKLKCAILLFKNSEIDVGIVDVIMREAISNNLAGTNDLITKFRNNVKNMYKESDKMLMNNVCFAIEAIDCKYATLPYNNTSFILCDNPTYSMDRYNNACCDLSYFGSNAKVPIVRYYNEICIPKTITAQCIRQWVRAVLAKMYHINAYSDVAIYMMILFFVQHRYTKMATTYYNLAIIMLMGNKTTTTETKLDYLLSGNKYVVDSDIQQAAKLCSFGANTNANTLWYNCCLAIQQFSNDKYKLADAQRKWHYSAETLTVPQCSVYESSPNYIWQCPVTNENVTSHGYRIVHNKCSPMEVYSEHGYNMINKSLVCCHKCFSPLTNNNFERIEYVIHRSEVPLPNFTFSNYMSNTTSNNTFNTTSNNTSNNTFNTSSNNTSYQNASSNNTSYQNTSSNNASLSNVEVLTTQPVKIIFMRGTVGSGKTTASNYIAEECSRRGWDCLIVGVDKYCKNGYSTTEASNKNHEDITTFLKNLDKKGVIVVDLCNENVSSRSIFNHNLYRGESKIAPKVEDHVTFLPNYFKDDLMGYLGWSLKNVLDRSLHNSNTSYWLNPVSAGVDTCIGVHKRKAQSVFGKSNVNKFNPQERDKYAYGYATRLASSYNLHNEVLKLLS